MDSLNETKLTLPANFTWNINEADFTEWFRNSNYVPPMTSPVFSPQACRDVQFCLKFVLENYKFSRTYSLRMQIVISKQPSVLINGQITLPNNNKNLLNGIPNTKKIENHLLLSSDAVGINFWHFKSIKQTATEVYSQIASINCQLQVTLNFSYQPNCLQTLMRNLNSLRQKPDYADVTFKVDGKLYLANKCILVARSSVFETMFGNANFIENKQNIVKIDDISGPVFEGLLEYIYTAKVNALKVSAPKLLQAAHKYDIPELVLLCAYSMMENITVENAAETLHLAELFNVTPLKGKAIEFINQNSKNVVKSAAWKELIKPNKELMIELYEDMISKQIQ